jgi:hypothetical protein
LSELQEILNILLVLSRFLFSWSLRQDSFHLEFQSRFFLRGKEKDSCLNFKKSWISCYSCSILLFLNNQTRFFSSWTSDKNLFSFLSKGILPDHYDWKESCLITKKNKNLERNEARSSTSVCFGSKRVLWSETKQKWMIFSIENPKKCIVFCDFHFQKFVFMENKYDIRNQHTKLH